MYNNGSVPLFRNDEDMEAMTKGGVKNAAFTVLDVTKIPAKEGQPRCPRCSGAVFQAESMPCRNRVSTHLNGVCPAHTDTNTLTLHPAPLPSPSSPSPPENIAFTITLIHSLTLN